MLPKYKEIVDLVKKGATIEAQEKIMELREAAVELQQENSELKEKIHLLEEQIKQSQEMKFHAPFYYKSGGEVPLCPRCWEVEKRAIHYPEPFNSAAGPKYSCPECGKSIIHPKRQTFRGEMKPI